MLHDASVLTHLCAEFSGMIVFNRRAQTKVVVGERNE